MHKCEVKNCLKIATATVYCQMHYRRLRLYGDVNFVLKKQRSLYDTSSIRIEGEIAFIELTQGKEAIIDVADIEAVGKYNWHYSPLTGYPYSYKAGTSLHQFILGKAPSGFEWDHDDRNKLNNRRSNLKAVTHSNNMLNSARSDGRKGYAFHAASGKYQAYLSVHSKCIYLGVYDSEIEAKSAHELAFSLKDKFTTKSEFKTLWKLMRHTEMTKRDE